MNKGRTEGEGLAFGQAGFYQTPYNIDSTWGEGHSTNRGLGLELHTGNGLFVCLFVCLFRKPIGGLAINPYSGV